MLSVVLQSIFALRDTAASSEDGCQKDLPVLHRSRDLSPAVCDTFLTKDVILSIKLGPCSDHPTEIHFWISSAVPLFDSSDFVS